MRTQTKMRTHKVAVALLFSALSFCAIAQKLPNVQTTSLRAPDNIKIDGKTTEWDNQFQAYNHSAEVYYTISNDDQRLYLTVQATVPDILSKIIAGGITFNIQKNGKKEDKGSMGITFPLYEKNNRPSLGITRKMTMENGVANTETIAPPMNDSTINARNMQLRDKSKNIGVIGIPGLDTLISVYNENGIKTGQMISSKGAYTYELAIDLKLLGLSASDASKFAYHIIVNGVNGGAVKMDVKTSDGSPPSPEMQNMMNDMMAKLSASSGGMMTPTDFWGEYTLAKK